ncbi:hypothetical protein V2G26_012795 [Clonostachys chloroleuca]
MPESRQISSMPSDRTPAQIADLSRARNNQRRSRARKKIYVQHLEDQLRAYERRGIEASVQMQTAAKRVTEENRKLRGLFWKQGLSDAHINQLLQGASSSTASELEKPDMFTGNFRLLSEFSEQLAAFQYFHSPSVPLVLQTQASKPATTSLPRNQTQEAMSPQFTYEQAGNIQAAIAAPDSMQPYPALLYSSNMISQDELYSPHHASSASGGRHSKPYLPQTEIDMQHVNTMTYISSGLIFYLDQ